MLHLTSSHQSCRNSAAQRVKVELVVGRPANDTDQLRDGGDDGGGVAMRLDEDRVGIDAAQCGQLVHMLLNLEHPMLAGMAPPQLLEPHLVHCIAEGRVDALNQS